MIISFTYNGKPYVNYNTESDDFKTLDIPDAEKTGIVSDAKWKQIRVQRDPLMRETDWTQMPDAQLTAEQKAEFSDYRQALRDIPQTYPDPDTIVWPEKPII